MALSKVGVSVLALLSVVPSDAIKVKSPKLRGGENAPATMQLYQHDCGQPSGFSFAQNPGSGMTPSEIKPFEKVLKDGFYSVDCVKDYMFEHGDKFGDNKASYKLAQLTNVSIVHYTAHVPKEDRQEMTHEVCFRFCRTVPDMAFFGLTNGRECYCTPYYQQEASDSSECDAVCDGDKGTMCGGKTKSSMFAMHMCADTQAEITKMISTLTISATVVQEYTKYGAILSEMVTVAANDFQARFGNAGDPGASDQMQAAKVRAGLAAEMMTRAAGRLEVAAKLKGEAQALVGAGQPTSSEAVVKAEELMKAMEKAIADLTHSATEIKSEFANSVKQLASKEKANDAAKKYYAAAYFVEKEVENKPSTCTGTAAEPAMTATLDGCARACDQDVHDCVAFQHYAAPNAPQGAPESIGICFLFSKLQTLRVYTGCQSVAGVQCRAKLSKFEGTSIKPDASGKCEGCLTDFTKADRCFV